MVTELLSTRAVRRCHRACLEHLRWAWGCLVHASGNQREGSAAGELRGCGPDGRLSPGPYLSSSAIPAWWDSACVQRSLVNNPIGIVSG